MKFKKGDFVELTYEGVFQNKIGIVVRIDESYTFSVVVDFGGTRYDRFLPNGKANYLSGIRIKKHYAFTPKQMIDFANWCISNGAYGPNVDGKDLVIWINEQKEKELNDKQEAKH
jgi:hypothetical protein